MQPFAYERPATLDEALTAAGQDGTRFLAGGTTLLDLMKLHVEAPARLVDITRLPLDRIDVAVDGGPVRIGATVSNTAIAYDKTIQARYLMLSQAILAGASPQIRNMATAAGNLMQRVRCPYFRDGISACNKRQPGSGCAMRGGFDRTAAVLGTTDQCIATHPSDMAVALLALDAIVLTRAPGGADERRIAFAEFYPRPIQPQVETALRPGEMITGIEVPALQPGARQAYLKIRDRASYEFALASVAGMVWLDGAGTITAARVALGGVGAVPWRDRAAEKLLEGRKPDSALFRRVAEVIFKDARAGKHNAFKIELGKRAVEACLGDLSRPERPA